MKLVKSRMPIMAQMILIKQCPLRGFFKNKKGVLL